MEILRQALFELVPYVVPLTVATFCGGLIGLEREWAGKPAGLRTNITICVGSCLFSLMSLQVGLDPARIAAQIVTGVGFIGAGAIIHDYGNANVTGVTTAATIWLVAAVGMALGFGNIALGLAVSVFGTLTLFVLRFLEPGKDHAD